MDTDTAGSRRASISAFVVLVVLPTASAAAAWVNWFGDYGWESTASLVLTAIPFVGLAAAVVHIAVTRIWSSLLLFLPFGLGAVAFAVNWAQVRSACSADPDCNPIPVVAFLAGMLLPVLALGGGMFSWINLRRPAGERIRLDL